MARKKKGPRYSVVDNETGRTGHLEERGGYLLGGAYVNPSWAIVWDEED